MESSPEEDSEEFAIHYYDGFEGLNISEYESIGRDMEMNGDFFTIVLGYRKLHLFHNL